MKHGIRQGGEKGPRVGAHGAVSRAAGPVPPPHTLASLQQTHGNRFVTRALSVQRKCECGGRCEECKAIQRKGGGAPGPVTAELSSYFASPGGGQTLGSPPHGGASQVGGSIQGVRIHNDSRAHAATRALDARALTVGSNIFFSAGRYQPGTAAGNKLLSHELAHVAQQRNGSVGAGLVEDRALEKEADDVAAGRASTISSLGRTSVQRQPEDESSKRKTDEKEDEEEEKSSAGAPPKKDRPSELRPLDLLPHSLRPDLQPEETDSERLQRLLAEDVKAADRAKGMKHVQGGTASPSPAAMDPKSVTEPELVAAARALLARCTRDQKDKGDPQRRVTEEGPPKTLEPKDNGTKIKESIEACLDTPEGEIFTAKAKSYLLSKRGAPITIGAVGALLSNLAITGKITYIPPIPLGKGAELSLEIDGPVDKPEQVMLKLKVSEDSRLGQALWKGVKAVGKGLATFGGWIWKGVTTVAGWIWTGVKWLARRVFDKIVGILGRVVQWMLKLPTRLGRLLKTLIEGVAAIRPWSLKFWESLGRAGTWGDFLKWLGTVGLDIAELAGVGEVYETAADLLKFNTRSIKDDERNAGVKVFGSTIPWHLVRIDESAVLGPASTKREYTSFHTINGWGGLTLDTLIHELTHVWQYETAGAIYMPQALHAQATAGYDYGDLQGLHAARASGRGILSFNREQQAQIVQDFFRIAQGSSPMMSSGTRADQSLYASFVKDVSSHQEVHLASLKV